MGAERPHLVLIGPMASGKTTLGWAISSRTGRPFIDSDLLLEAEQGRSGREIAAAEGVEHLHQLEGQILRGALARARPAVISAAASVADRPDLLALAARRAVVVLVEADPELLVGRVEDGPHRRVVTPDRIRELHSRRRPAALAVADLVIDTGVIGVEEAVERIVATVDGESQQKERRSMPSTFTNRRVVIEGVSPSVDDGRFAVKRVVGDELVVEADAFCDGHDAITCTVRYRFGEEPWRETPMQPLVNDRWRGSFTVDRVGRWSFTVEGWVDHFATWRAGLEKKVDAGVDVGVDLQIGSALVSEGVERADGEDAETLRSFAERLADQSQPLSERVAAGLHPALAATMAAHPDRSSSTTFDRELPVKVERERARFSSWYELFPRSWGPEPGVHGTFLDVAERLDYVADMGFDILYLPPIHPIGHTNRKGPNNALVAGPDDPGVPWAIGSEEGGHTAINPALGTLDDFRKLRDRATSLGIELALDIAFQCSPDHPWVTEHPEWFKHRPDGSVQYAENPPKKYEDIYPLDFETSDPEGLWQALKGVFDYWINEGVLVFRVDNPHTKSFPFWEWCIAEIHAEHPEVIFLSEAFTRPKMMYRLAKLGFTQSYTYFTWRNTPSELREYLTELTRTNVVEFFRPNFWPNTPDILHEFLQSGGRAAFIIRLVLASTLSSNYGIYGPAFELQERTPRNPGSEEYLDSEKYQIRSWDLERPDSLAPLIAEVNQVRRDHPALQSNRTLTFHDTDNDMLLCYSKAAGDDVVLCVVNLDPHYTQSGWTSLDLTAMGVEPDQPFLVHDLLTDQEFMWMGPRNFVMLDPGMPAHVFSVRRRVRTEQDFDYYQ